MDFLIDNNLSPSLCKFLIETGHSAVHTKELKMSGASDDELFLYAYINNKIIISADTDFGFILSKWKQNLPSVILLRFISTIPSIQIEYLRKIILNYESELVEGAIIVVDSQKVRIKKLPF